MRSGQRLTDKGGLTESRRRRRKENPAAARSSAHRAAQRQRGRVEPRRDVLYTGGVDRTVIPWIVDPARAAQALYRTPGPPGPRRRGLPLTSTCRVPLHALRRS
jgi:hypothetical protein